MLKKYPKLTEDKSDYPILSVMILKHLHDNSSRPLGDYGLNPSVFHKRD
jgi:hypothetical protein